MRSIEWVDGRKVVSETPMLCSPAQMRLVLHRQGLLDLVQGIVSGDPEASIVWEYATVIERESPWVQALKGQSGLSDNQIDALFLAAMAMNSRF